MLIGGAKAQGVRCLVASCCYRNLLPHATAVFTAPVAIAAAGMNALEKATAMFDFHFVHNLGRHAHFLLLGGSFGIYLRKGLNEIAIEHIAGMLGKGFILAAQDVGFGGMNDFKHHGHIVGCGVAFRAAADFVRRWNVVVVVVAAGDGWTVRFV